MELELEELVSELLELAAVAVVAELLLLTPVVLLAELLPGPPPVKFCALPLLAAVIEADVLVPETP